MAETKQTTSGTSGAGSRRSAGAANIAGTDSDGLDGRTAPVGQKGTRARSGSANGATKAGKTASPEGKTAARKTSSRGSRQPDLKKDLREFASARPQGWNHEDWLEFLESLQTRGHNISDREAIGVALEKERLHLALAALKGIGPQKRESLAEYYGNIWQLRHADLDEITRVGNIQRKDAERIKSELR